MKDVLVNQGIQGLCQFQLIAQHPGLDRQRLAELVSATITDTSSRNTREEIATAAELAERMNAKQLVLVTNGSHAPRCMAEIVKARLSGTIPTGQLWSVMADDMVFPGTATGDTGVTVLERAHRGDDSMFDQSPQLYEVARRFFRLGDRTPHALGEVDAILSRYGA